MTRWRISNSIIMMEWRRRDSIIVSGLRRKYPIIDTGWGKGFNDCGGEGERLDDREG